MILNDLSDTIIAFDLDDTLYNERCYVKSGIEYVCKRVEFLKGGSFLDEIMQSFLLGERDWISLLCKKAGLAPAAKDSLLWMYRLHEPSIRLSASCSAMLAEAERRSKAVLIVTDGRSVTQRLKIEALGLSHIPIFVSEDFESEKPDPIRFQMIERDYPASLYVYVGDNPNKDFYAANGMGWRTIGIRPKSGNVHSYDIANFPADAVPQLWVDDWENFLEKLC